MSRWIAIGIGITLFLLVMQTAALLVAKLRGEEVEDLLAPYAEVMPGQRMDVFTPSQCNTYGEIPQEGIRTCSLQPPDESQFFSVNIYVRDHIIRRVTLRSSTLVIGDLPLDWGRPSIVYASSSYYVRWEIPDYSITVSLGEHRQLNYWLPVSFLAIEANPATDESCQQAECPRSGNGLSARGDVQFAEYFIDIPLHGTDG
jgi:hypothetical protein